MSVIYMTLNEQRRARGYCSFFWTLEHSVNAWRPSECVWFVPGTYLGD